MPADIRLFSTSHPGDAASITAALEVASYQVIELVLFATEESQEPTYNSIIDNASPIQLSPSQPAPDWNGLIATPAHFRQQLTTRQVLLWQVPSQETLWAVSTPAHTAVVGGVARPHIDLVTVRPAKGSGGMRLYIGALALYDTYSSPTLRQLAAAIEERTKLTISQSETQDC